MNALSIHVSDSIAILTLAQPDSKVNVLSRALWAELGTAFAELAACADLHGLILESAKHGIFIAGADLNELANVPCPDHPPTRAFIERGLRVLESLESLPFPTVACVDGAALGGGFEVALACDFRIAGTNLKTRFGLPEVTLGLIPGWGGTQRLPRIIGPELAIQVMLCAVEVTARSTPIEPAIEPAAQAREEAAGSIEGPVQTALSCGLVSSIVPSENLLSAATALLQQSWADGSWKTTRAKKRQPIAVAASAIGPRAMEAHRSHIETQMKDSLCRPSSLALLDVLETGATLPLAEAIELETAAFMKLAGSPESRQLIEGFFASRKK